MPDLKISQLPAASTPLAGTELVPVVQGGITEQTTVQSLLTSTVPSGTANGVMYLNGSKVATSGSALTFDGNNLTQSGASAAVSLLVNTANTGVSASNYSEIQLADAGSVRTYWRNLRDGSGATIFSGNDHIRYALGSSEQMRLTSTGLGIGTSSPTNALSVTGNANITGNTTLGDATTDTVTVNGYMGVGGAVSSSAAVFVRNSALTGTNQYGVRIGVTGSQAGTSSVRGVYTALSTEAAAYTTASAIGYQVDDVTKGAGSTITNQHGVYITDQTQGTNNYGITSLVSSGTNKWNIYASGTAQNYFAGNVGIGTSSPAQKLVVSNAGAQGFEFDPTNGILQVYNRSTSAYGELRPYGSLIRWFTGTSPTEKMRLDSSGNLGIGTSSPSEKLDVAGGAKLTGTVVTTTGSDAFSAGSGTGTSIRVNALFKGTDASGNARTSYIGTNIHGTDGSLEFANNVTGLTATIDASGNLIHKVNGTAPSLSTNSMMSFELTSNTSLKIVVRGTDGVTRSASLTLA